MRPNRELILGHLYLEIGRREGLSVERIAYQPAMFELTARYIAKMGETDPPSCVGETPVTVTEGYLWHTLNRMRRRPGSGLKVNVRKPLDVYPLTPQQNSVLIQAYADHGPHPTGQLPYTEVMYNIWAQFLVYGGYLNANGDLVREGDLCRHLDWLRKHGRLFRLGDINA